MSAESLPVLTKPAPHVAKIEFNRPDNANRIQPEDLEALTEMLDACEADDQLHVLLLTARGKYFSAGYDLRALATQGAAGHHTDAGNESAFEHVADRIERTRLATVAALNGPVIGGATDFALACDIRIGLTDAYMLMPAARFGLPLYAGALQRYVSRLGLNHAKRLVFMAQKVEATEMVSIGFLQELVSPDALEARAMAIAIEIAAMPAVPLAAMKQTLNAAVFGNGTAPAQRAALLAAFDGPKIAQRIMAAQARRGN
ncbi:enoyl-CoA hydratase/isomerase family protein [Noviherbaspirillum saxi]|uniref:Enoyl-CoA hydratase/isomerase family protein n=1 Tax=Noviherbaspirillum saxi TaxID=2320863 RepID=A0A3A3FJF5_9BURK|nr:enoyl-CoA hydratase/isomerase family protein [Noviherbaspirillum saxi]RJF95628.1 enoyl-CoA hydratase/isomerase family protein [Noviherbaspirillum saxi]